MAEDLADIFGGVSMDCDFQNNFEWWRTLCERSSSEEGGDKVSICLVKVVMMIMLVMVTMMMRMNMLIRLSELDRNS